MKLRYKYYIIFSLVIGFISCKKMVAIPEPTNSITSTETFSNSDNATSAITGIYSNMSWARGGNRYSNGQATIILGMSADEINRFGSSVYQTNTILSNDATISNSFWSALYYDIYMSNAVIEGVQGSKNLTSAIKKQLVGEAKFIRAFCHFYLLNLFGDIPLVTTTAWANSSILGRTSSPDVYQQIIEDLKDAESLLADDYSVSNGERIRPNKWAATALLARVYLYTKDWQNAENEANTVINKTNTYNLLSDLNGVFLANSSEAIWQLQVVNAGHYATLEGNSFIPTSNTKSPNYYLINSMIGAFESNDNRRIAWVDSTKYSGKYYYYPYKYKVRQGSSGNIIEYYTILRLAEQYLIRAEARAEENKLNDAIIDLNIIRTRAGLSNLPLSLTQSEVLSAVAQERRIELFAEWGHRWLDLKRTGKVDAVLSTIKSTWKPYAQLYPIPASELLRDPNLRQNPGYN